MTLQVVMLGTLSAVCASYLKAAVNVKAVGVMLLQPTSAREYNAPWLYGSMTKSSP